MDDRARDEITRSFRSIGDDNAMDVKRQRLGEPLGRIVGDMMTDDRSPVVHEEGRRERFTRNFAEDRRNSVVAVVIRNG